MSTASPPRGSDQAPDIALPDLLGALDAAAYSWDLATDRLVWQGDPRTILGIEDAATLATGAAFAAAASTKSYLGRFDAIINSGDRDPGSGVPFTAVYTMRDKAGADIWIEDSGRWFAGPDGKPSHALGMIRAVTERHDQIKRLALLSTLDPLTKTASRARLADLLETMLQEAGRQRGSFGFILLAIENLPQLNQAYGYQIADEVIVGVVQRLRARIRSTDQIGRFSGNKFGMTIAGATAEDLRIAAERFIGAASGTPVATSGGPISATVALGAVVAPRHARSAAEIIARAQEALDVAKTARRPGVVLYAPDGRRDQRRRENIRITDAIIGALNARRVSLAFQPIVDALTARPVEYECLVRLKDASGVLLPAAEIVPVAERLGLAQHIDHRVIELVAEELVMAPETHLAVNISATSAICSDWLDTFAALARANPGIAERLTVEITETAIIEDLEETHQLVRAIKDLGSRVAIDDFGSGHTSFKAMRQLGIDIVKIDGSFLNGFDESDEDRFFVRALLDLANNLGVVTVAEWVQTAATAEQLVKWGCRRMQGALFGLASETRPWVRLDDGAARVAPARPAMPVQAAL